MSWCVGTSKEEPSFEASDTIYMTDILKVRYLQLALQTFVVGSDPDRVQLYWFQV